MDMTFDLLEIEETMLQQAKKPLETELSNQTNHYHRF